MATSEQYNMGPFSPVSIKGNAPINGVPTFIDKLPLTIGGIAGDDVHFGRVVSIIPGTNRRQFVEGCPSGAVVKGIAMYNPVIGRADPGMNDHYFTGRPMTAQTMGLIDIMEWDTAGKAPMEGSTVYFRKDNGMLAFDDGTGLGADYIKLDNAFVYESLDPNGAKIWIGIPLVATQTRETVATTATPTADPNAGAVDSGTAITLSCADPNAVIYYTLDGSTVPTMTSLKYTSPIIITAATTVKAIAIAEGKEPSAVFTAAYTLN